MQIYGLLVLASPPGAGAVPLTTAWELGSFSWLQRGTVQDMMGFMARVCSSSSSTSHTLMCTCQQCYGHLATSPVYLPFL